MPPPPSHLPLPRRIPFSDIWGTASPSLTDPRLTLRLMLPKREEAVWDNGNPIVTITHPHLSSQASISIITTVTIRRTSRSKKWLEVISYLLLTGAFVISVDIVSCFLLSSCLPFSSESACTWTFAYTHSLIQSVACSAICHESVFVTHEQRNKCVAFLMCLSPMESHFRSALCTQAFCLIMICGPINAVWGRLYRPLRNNHAIRGLHFPGYRTFRESPALEAWKIHIHMFTWTRRYNVLGHVGNFTREKQFLQGHIVK